MTHSPSWTELALLVTALGAIGRWWIERRDKRSAQAKANEELTEAKAEADKAVRTLTEALAAKNVELAAKDQIIDRHERRINHLESLVYGVRSQT